MQVKTTAATHTRYRRVISGHELDSSLSKTGWNAASELALNIKTLEHFAELSIIYRT